MSRIQTQSLPVSSPGQLGALAPEPTQRQIFASSVGVDQTAAQLLGVLQSVGQAASVYGQFATRKQEQEVEQAWEVASSRVLELDTELRTLDPNDDDYEEKAAAIQTQINAFNTVASAQFSGTKRQADWANLIGQAEVHAAVDLREYRKQQQDRAERWFVNSTGNFLDETVIKTSATKLTMDEFIATYRSADGGPEALMNSIGKHLRDTMTDEQLNLPEEFGPEVQEQIDGRFVAAQHRLFVEVIRQDAEVQQKADKSTKEESIQAATITLVNLPGSDFENVLNGLDLNQDRHLVQARALEWIDGNIGDVDTVVSLNDLTQYTQTLNKIQESIQPGQKNGGDLQRGINSIKERLIEKYAVSGMIAITEYPAGGGADMTARDRLIYKANRDMLENHLQEALNQTSKESYRKAVAQDEVNGGWNYLTQHPSFIGQVAKRYETILGNSTGPARMSRIANKRDQAIAQLTDPGSVSGQWNKDLAPANLVLDEPEAAIQATPVQVTAVLNEEILRRGGTPITNPEQLEAYILKLEANEEEMTSAFSTQMITNYYRSAQNLESALKEGNRVKIAEARNKMWDAAVQFERPILTAARMAAADEAWLTEINGTDTPTENFRRLLVRTGQMSFEQLTRYSDSANNQTLGAVLLRLKGNLEFTQADLERKQELFSQEWQQVEEFNAKLATTEGEREWNKAITKVKINGKSEELDYTLRNRITQMGAYPGLTDEESIEKNIMTLKDMGYMFHKGQNGIRIVSDILGSTPEAHQSSEEEVNRAWFANKFKDPNSSVFRNVFEAATEIGYTARISPISSDTLRFARDVELKLAKPVFPDGANQAAKLATNNQYDNWYDAAEAALRSFTGTDGTPMFDPDTDIKQYFGSGRFYFQYRSEFDSSPGGAVLLRERVPGSNDRTIKSWTFDYSQLQQKDPTVYAGQSRRVIPAQVGNENLAEFTRGMPSGPLP